MTFRSGFVGILGLPNVGKSTLLNRVLEQHLAIISPKPQTTRNRILGIKNLPEAQICFVDTPGVHVPKGALNQYMVKNALALVDDADLVLVLLDASDPRSEQMSALIGKRLAEANATAWLVLNKVDLVPKPTLLPLIELHAKGFEEVYCISAKKGEGVDELVAAVTKRMPEGPAYFPDDIYSDQAERFFVAELVREQLVLQTEQELPYQTAVLIEAFDDLRKEEGGGLCRIQAQILVARDSQKGIVLGKGGSRIKSIGTKARLGIERFLGCKVHLELHVRVEPDWPHSERGLRRAGYEK